MDKKIYFNELFIIYGNFLTSKEQEIFRLYYEEDLTMQEIANYKNVSKSGIGSKIKHCEEKLLNYEKNLHINQKQEKILKIINDDKLREQIRKVFREE